MVKSFFLIASSKYINVFVEYLVVILTSQFLPLEQRGDFIMITSTAIFIATVSGLSFDQYGAKEFYKNKNFNYLSYFKSILWVGVGLLLLALPICYYYLSFSLVAFSLMVLLTLGILTTKQIIVIYQVRDFINDYSKIIMINKLVLIFILFGVSYYSPTLYSFLIFYIFSFILTFFFLMTNPSARNILNSEFDSNNFLESFNQNKLIYFTTIVTSLFYYVNYLLIYKYIDKTSLSYYHIAIQYNLAFIVLAQSFNIYFLSNKSRVTVSYFFKSLPKIMLFIIIISLVNLVLVYSDFFPLLVSFIFSDKYLNSIDIFQKVILVLPSMLISMFFVSLWIVSNQYKRLFIMNIISLVLFFISASLLMNFYSNSIESIIYALYIANIYGIFANFNIVYYFKRKATCYR